MSTDSSHPTTPSSSNVEHGLILFAHGARDPRWATPFEAVAEQIRRRDPQLKVGLAYLEFMAPDLVTAGLALAAQGCRVVGVLPMFLGAGGHVRKDLPLLMDTLRTQAPSVDWQLWPAIGEAQTVIDAMAHHALAAFKQKTSP